MPLRSGRRWIDVQDPAEASALAAGYAALLRAFPAAGGGVERGGMVPLDELTAAVRRVAETWSRGQPQQAAAGTAAASDGPAAGSLPARRPASVGRKRASLAARPCERPAATAPLQAPPPLPPAAPRPSDPVCPWSTAETLSGGDDDAESWDDAAFDGMGDGGEEGCAGMIDDGL